MRNGTQWMKSCSCLLWCEDCCWMGLKPRFTVHWYLKTIQTMHAVTFHNWLSLKLASNAVFEVYKFPCWPNLLLLSTGNARQHVGWKLHQIHSLQWVGGTHYKHMNICNTGIHEALCARSNTYPPYSPPETAVKGLSLKLTGTHER